MTVTVNWMNPCFLLCTKGRMNGCCFPQDESFVHEVGLTFPALMRPHSHQVFLMRQTSVLNPSRSRGLWGPFCGGRWGKLCKANVVADTFPGKWNRENERALHTMWQQHVRNSIGVRIFCQKMAQPEFSDWARIFWQCLEFSGCKVRKNFWLWKNLMNSGFNAWDSKSQKFLAWIFWHQNFLSQPRIFWVQQINWQKTSPNSCPNAKSDVFQGGSTSVVCSRWETDEQLLVCHGNDTICLTKVCQAHPEQKDLTLTDPDAHELHFRWHGSLVLACFPQKIASELEQQLKRMEAFLIKVGFISAEKMSHLVLHPGLARSAMQEWKNSLQHHLPKPKTVDFLLMAHFATHLRQWTAGWPCHGPLHNVPQMANCQLAANSENWGCTCSMS